MREAKQSPEELRKELDEINEAEEKNDEVAKLKAKYSKYNFRKSLAQIAIVISVFQYSMAVFYAQLALTNKIEDCLQDPSLLKCQEDASNTEQVFFIWLSFETITFYTYMGATCIYITFNMFYNSFIVDARSQSDISKVLEDFISYANINLTWFAFNMCLLVLPVFCVLRIQSEYEYLDNHEDT